MPLRTTRYRDRSTIEADDFRRSLADNGGWATSVGNNGLLPSTISQGGSNLTALGATTYSASGSVGAPIVIADKIFNGLVKFTGAYYRLSNCKFAGYSTASQGNVLVDCRDDNAANIVFEDCLWDPGANANVGLEIAIAGHDFTVRRGKMRNTEDFIRPLKTGGGNMNVNVFMTRTESNAFWAPNPYRAPSDNQSHSDSSQFDGGYGMLFESSDMYGYLSTEVGQGNQAPVYDTGGTGYLLSGNPRYPLLQNNSVATGTPLTYTLSGLNYNQNRMQGGQYMMNFPNTNVSAANGGVVITNNDVGYARSTDHLFMADATIQQYFTVTGNHRLEDGSSWNTIGNT